MLFLDYSFVAQLQFISSSSTANRKAYKPVMFSLHSFFENTQKRFPLKANLIVDSRCFLLIRLGLNLKKIYIFLYVFPYQLKGRKIESPGDVSRRPEGNPNSLRSFSLSHSYVTTYRQVMSGDLSSSKLVANPVDAYHLVLYIYTYHIFKHVIMQISLLF